MNNLTLHIEYLLRHHDCVIMPGVGAFMKRYREASVKEDGTLLPPATEVSFNASIQSNDGLLAHSLMRRNGSTFEEAKALMTEMIEDLKLRLKDDRELSFGKLGVLSMGEDDKICFSPFAISGFGSFRAISAREPQQTKTAAAADEVSETAGERRFDTRRNFYIAINKRFARVAAVLCFVVAAASTFVVPSMRMTDYSDFQRASVMPMDWASKTPSAIAPDTTKTTETASAIEVETTSEANNDSHSFYLIVATFKTTEECESFIASQPSDIAGKLKIKAGKKVNRVYYASSDSREELSEIMKDNGFRASYSQAWIWEA